MVRRDILLLLLTSLCEQRNGRSKRQMFTCLIDSGNQQQSSRFVFHQTSFSTCGRVRVLHFLCLAKSYFEALTHSASTSLGRDTRTLSKTTTSKRYATTGSTVTRRISVRVHETGTNLKTARSSGSSLLPGQDIELYSVRYLCLCRGSLAAHRPRTTSRQY